jgi:hypothetical protein
VLIAAGWSSLDIAKLVVAALIPVAIFSAGLIVAREARKYEERQWVARKLFEARLECWDKFGPPLLDLNNFFALIGRFREITPPEAFELRRKIDEVAYTNVHVLGAGFLERYNTFMHTCFVAHAGFGAHELLRTSLSLQRAERGPSDWDPIWDQFFAPEDMASTPADVGAAYSDLLNSFTELDLPRGE